MNFSVRLDAGETMDASRRGLVQAMAQQASWAWDAIHDKSWTGGVMQ